MWQLKKALYGTRRAALLCQEHVMHDMVKIGFTAVREAAQSFHHATWLVLATVHGDDITAAGDTPSLDMLDETLVQFSVLKKMPRIGPPEVGGASDGQFTKGTVSWRAYGFHWKADDSHGGKVVGVLFSSQARSNEEDDVTKHQSTLAEAHEMHLKNLSVRYVTGTDGWYRQHTTWLWISQICSTPRQCSCEHWRHF